MAYHGYINFLHTVARQYKTPVILEIGIHTGITAISLLHRLSHSHKNYYYFGVDILVRDDLLNTICFMGLKNQKNIFLHEMNSFEFLKNNTNTYDIILIDGDHNYYTVSNELSYLNKISHKNTVVIVDDYYGKFATEDSFYSEYDHDNYQSNERATKKIITEKNGVKTAVDEFINLNENWKTFKIMDGEPIVLFREQNTILTFEENK
tara:strand:- start:400 stop:1020 length:621 start_codon:yes stop_codon:yes gene_type:complete